MADRDSPAQSGRPGRSASAVRHAGELEARGLRQAVIGALRSQGFVIDENQALGRASDSKDAAREMNRQAVASRRERARARLARHESRLLDRFADGRDVVPARIRPVLVPVARRSEEELLFRYASLHWSIPVSRGYGRRIRFIVVDGHNGKLIGLLGLGDPVYALAPRDEWVGWNERQRRERLWHVLDAFVLGAVPPYNRLLGGKLIAMLATSREIREAFADRYLDRRTRVGGRRFNDGLAMLTTTSALGRSSLYARLRDRRGVDIWHPVGYTAGSGDFHFGDDLYERLAAFLREHEPATAKHEGWGTGYRNRREVIGKALRLLGLPYHWVYHGIRREVYCAPLAANARDFLTGRAAGLDVGAWSADEAFAWFRERWLLARARRIDDWRDFERESLRLWGDG